VKVGCVGQQEGDVNPPVVVAFAVHRKLQKLGHLGQEMGHVSQKVGCVVQKVNHICQKVGRVILAAMIGIHCTVQ